MKTGVSLSTTEMEYVAASEIIKNIIAARRILQELNVIDENFPFFGPVDNTGAIALSGGKKIIQNACYIDIHYRHVWDLIGKRMIEILHIIGRHRIQQI